MAAALLACTACSQQDAPTEDIAKAAEQVVARSPEPIAQAKGRFAPRDECGKVEGAGDFRRQLAAAIETRDVEALAALAAEDIELDFGGGAGSAELRRRLTEVPGLWDELDELMTLGCAANEQGGISIPWYFAQDLGNLDVFEAYLVIGEDVPLLDRPDAAGKPLTKVSWDVVRIAEYQRDRPFQHAALSDGTVAFVASDKLRSVIDYRLIASSRNGKWRITSFIAGD